MATSTPVPTTPDSAGEPGHDQESPLDRSRAKTTAAQEALAEARRRVEAVAGQLEQNLAKATADENALGAALDEVDRLKRALKDGQKERRKLVLARKRATADMGKAEDKARKAEAKYDRAVLADLIEREKEHDREGTTAVAVPAGAPAVASGAPPNGQTAPVAKEPEDLATATARTTAARTTATDAGEGAQPAPKPPPPSPRRSSPGTRTSRSTSSAASTAKATSEDAPDQA
jgi:hypothetical protein